MLNIMSTEALISAWSTSLLFLNKFFVRKKKKKNFNTTNVHDDVLTRMNTLKHF